MDGALVEVIDGALVDVMDGALVVVIDGALVEVMDGEVDEVIDGALVVVIDGARVEDMDGEVDEVMDGAQVEVMDGALVEVVDGALVVGLIERVAVGAAVVGDTLGVMDELLEGEFVLKVTLPTLMAAVRKLPKLIEPNPVEGSHPTAGKKPSLQHLLEKVPDLYFTWLQPFLVPPVISFANCA
jgi:hypothetical protein